MMVLITRMATIMRPRWKQFRQKSFACYSSTHYSNTQSFESHLQSGSLLKEDACFHVHDLLDRLRQRGKLSRGNGICLVVFSFKIRTQTSRSGTWIYAFQIAGKYSLCAPGWKNTSWSFYSEHHYLCFIAYTDILNEWLKVRLLRSDSGLFEEESIT